MVEARSLSDDSINIRRQKVPWTYPPKVAFLMTLEKRVAFLEQALLDGRVITMKTKDGKKVRIRLTVEQQEIEVPVSG